MKIGTRSRRSQRDSSKGGPPVNEDSVAKPARILRSELELDEIPSDSAGSDPHRAIVVLGQRVEPYARDPHVRRAVIRFYFLIATGPVRSSDVIFPDQFVVDTRSAILDLRRECDNSAEQQQKHRRSGSHDCSSVLDFSHLAESSNIDFGPT